MKLIHSMDAPEAIGPYSQAVLVGNTLYVSGQLPVNKDGSVVNDIKEATKTCLHHILSIVKEANMKKENIVKCTVYLADLNTFSLMNEAYKQFFGNHKPARVAFEVSRLPRDVVVEIDAVAVL